MLIIVVVDSGLNTSTEVIGADELTKILTETKYIEADEEKGIAAF